MTIKRKPLGVDNIEVVAVEFKGKNLDGELLWQQVLVSWPIIDGTQLEEALRCIDEHVVQELDPNDPMTKSRREHTAELKAARGAEDTETVEARAVEKTVDLRGHRVLERVLTELAGEVSAVFMSQGTTPAKNIVMPAQELIDIVARTLQAFPESCFLVADGSYRDMEQDPYGGPGVPPELGARLLNTTAPPPEKFSARLNDPTPDDYAKFSIGDDPPELGARLADKLRLQGIPPEPGSARAQELATLSIGKFRTSDVPIPHDNSRGLFGNEDPVVRPETYERIGEVDPDDNK